MVKASPPAEFDSMRGDTGARRWKGFFLKRWRRHPVLWLVLIAAVSNLTGSVFNIIYNTQFIVDRVMNDAQKEVFYFALPVYNLVAYPVGLGITLYVLRHIRRNHQKVLRGE